MTGEGALHEFDRAYLRTWPRHVPAESDESEVRRGDLTESLYSHRTEHLQQPHSHACIPLLRQRTSTCHFQAPVRSVTREYLSSDPSHTVHRTAVFVRVGTCILVTVLTLRLAAYAARPRVIRVRQNVVSLVIVSAYTFCGYQQTGMYVRVWLYSQPQTVLRP